RYFLAGTGLYFFCKAFNNCFEDLLFIRFSIQSARVIGTILWFGVQLDTRGISFGNQMYSANRSP
ncbi:MAG: hypothetical protein LBP68_03535, partial [Acidobacteriota bacterium]|nr:hypothetical protein [Acidobacteriota bacterium]